MYTRIQGCCEESFQARPEEGKRQENPWLFASATYMSDNKRICKYKCNTYVVAGVINVQGASTGFGGLATEQRIC